MFEIYSFCRAVDDIADDPGPREPRRGQLQAWRADIDAIYAGSPPQHLAGLAQAVKQFNLQREDFMAVIDGMAMDVDADIRAPDRRRSIFIATASLARSAGSRCGCSAWSPMPAWRSPIIWAARCSSPTSCAISTKTRPWAGSICRARRCAKPGSSAPIRPRCWRNPMLGVVCDTVVALAREHFQRSARDHGAVAAPHGAGAAHHGRRLSRHPRQAGRTRFRAAARAGAPFKTASPSHRGAQSRVMQNSR